MTSWSLSRPQAATPQRSPRPSSSRRRRPWVIAAQVLEVPLPGQPGPPPIPSRVAREVRAAGVAPGTATRRLTHAISVWGPPGACRRGRGRRARRCGDASITRSTSASSSAPTGSAATATTSRRGSPRPRSSRTGSTTRGRPSDGGSTPLSCAGCTSTRAAGSRKSPRTSASTVRSSTARFIAAICRSSPPAATVSHGSGTTSWWRTVVRGRPLPPPASGLRASNPPRRAQALSPALPAALVGDLGLSAFDLELLTVRLARAVRDDCRNNAVQPPWLPPGVTVERLRDLYEARGVVAEHGLPGARAA